MAAVLKVDSVSGIFMFQLRGTSPLVMDETKRHDEAAHGDNRGIYYWIGNTFFTLVSFLLWLRRRVRRKTLSVPSVQCNCTDLKETRRPEDH